ncbi:putative leader peptide [Streptomyces acidiscabies]
MTYDSELRVPRAELALFSGLSRRWHIDLQRCTSCLCRG